MKFRSFVQKVDPEHKMGLDGLQIIMIYNITEAGESFAIFTREYASFERFLVSKTRQWL
jgi:hypothetical protein